MTARLDAHSDAFLPRRDAVPAPAAFEALKLFCFGALALALTAASVSGLYILKCALHINLLPGKSPLLHDLLYHLVR